MQKKIGSMMLIAGTCMGSGMIALPMVLAKIGLFPSLIFMALMWGCMYLSSLVGIELNLQAGKSLTLGQLGKHFSGPLARSIGTLSMKVLAYALLAAFLYGGSSILQRLVPSCSIQQVITGFAIVGGILLTFPTKWLDYINRCLFSTLLGGIILLIVILATFIDWSDLPLVSPTYKEISLWPLILPVVFTSFGFHTIIHTITKYCDNQASTLRKAFFWGSFIPVVAYIVWTASVVGTIHHHNPGFYQQMMAGDIEVGALVKELSSITKWPLMQLFVWCLLITKLVVSVIGVGLSLRDSLNTMIKKEGFFTHHVMSAALVMVPSYVIAMMVPNAFISVLSFAGMILAIIAILLPLYLLRRVKHALHYKELANKWILGSLLLVGIAAIGCEVFNLIHK